MISGNKEGSRCAYRSKVGDDWFCFFVGGKGSDSKGGGGYATHVRTFHTRVRPICSRTIRKNGDGFSRGGTIHIRVSVTHMPYRRSSNSARRRKGCRTSDKVKNSRPTLMRRFGRPRYGSARRKHTSGRRKQVRTTSNGRDRCSTRRSNVTSNIDRRKRTPRSRRIPQRNTNN